MPATLLRGGHIARGCLASLPPRRRQTHRQRKHAPSAVVPAAATVSSADEASADGASAGEEFEEYTEWEEVSASGTDGEQGSLQASTESASEDERDSEAEGFEGFEEDSDGDLWNVAGFEELSEEVVEQADLIEDRDTGDLFLAGPGIGRQLSAREAWPDERYEMPYDMQEMMSVYEQLDTAIEDQVVDARTGDLVTGIVVSVDKRYATIDIGTKALAEIDLSEATIAPIKDLNEIMWPGYERQFLVLGYDKQTSSPILSLRQFEEELLWDRLIELHDMDITMRGKISSVNLGGVTVDILAGARGFLPISHIGAAGTQLTFAEGDEADEAAREALIGQPLDVKFLEFDEGEGRFTLSARRAESADQLERFRIGDVVEGVVSKVLEYGVFVDVAGGGTGLLHVSQISHERVTDLTNLISVGDRIKVMIMSHDPDRGRLALSTKKLEPAPGDMLKNPQKVFETAEEMAELFRIRVLAAESVAEDARVGVAEAIDNYQQSNYGYDANTQAYPPQQGGYGGGYAQPAGGYQGNGYGTPDGAYAAPAQGGQYQQAEQYSQPPPPQ